MTTIPHEEDEFGIPRRFNKNAAPTTKEHAMMMDASTWAETASTSRPRTARVVTGGPRVEEQWVSTLFSDFNTITFGPVFSLFHTAVADPNQTALVVSRLVCVASGPEFFDFTTGSLRVLREENAGGASEFSEAVSFEYFHRLFGAELLKTEMSIGYTWGRWSKKTDYTCVLPDGTRLAVSVTRAMRFAGVFSEENARRLLSKKLHGCQMSNRDVLAEDRWNKQVLHIFTETVAAVQLLRTVFQELLVQQPELVGNTVVLITLTSNAPFLYFNFCSEQASMRFVASSSSAELKREELFTTAETAFSSSSSPAEDGEEAVHALLVAESAQQKSEFYYGYRTREEALANGALVLLPKGPYSDEDEGLGSGEEEGEEDLGLGSLWTEEGEGEEEDLGLGSLWMEEGEVEELGQATEAMALLEALPFACGAAEEAAEDKPTAAAEKKSLAHADEKEEKVCSTGASLSISSPTISRGRAAARRRWRTRKSRREQPRRSALRGDKPCGNKPCGSDSVKATLQPHSSALPPYSARCVDDTAPAQVGYPHDCAEGASNFGGDAKTGSDSRISAVLEFSIIKTSFGFPAQEQNSCSGGLALFTSSLSFAVVGRPSPEFQAPFSFLHGAEEEPADGHLHWPLGAAAIAAECSIAISRMFDEAQ